MSDARQQARFDVETRIVNGRAYEVAVIRPRRPVENRPAAVQNPRADLDHDLDHELSLTGGDLDQKKNIQDLDPADPDGLNATIRGQHAELLKTDPSFLQARSWGCHPITLRRGIARFGADAVRRHIAFVAGKPAGFFTKGRAEYLAHLLIKSRY